MNNKTKIIVGAAILSVIMFFGGYEYQKTTTPTTNSKAQFGTGTTSNQRGVRMGAAGAGGFTSGQIISMDAKSIVVGLRTGGSKIVFFSPSTTIEKQAAGTTSDLTANTQVSITGTTNADGSITAQSIQIRPQAPQGN